MSVIRGMTASGIGFELDRDRLNDMEVLDALAELEDGNALAISKVSKLLFGVEQRRDIYAQLRNEDGRVAVAAFSVFIAEMFAVIGADGKKS